MGKGVTFRIRNFLFLISLSNRLIARLRSQVKNEVIIIELVKPSPQERPKVGCGASQVVDKKKVL